MYCPEWHVEYRNGFTECSDCRIPLVAEKPPEARGLGKPDGEGDPDLEWVMVLEGSDRLMLVRVKGQLEDASIPFYVVGEEIGPRAAMVDDFIYPWWRVHVGIDREKEALMRLQTIGEADAANGAEEEEKPEAPM